VDEYSSHTTATAAAAAAAAATAATTTTTTGRPWQWFHENPVFAYIFEAFPLRIQKTADLDPKQVCVFVRRRFVVGMLTERALSVFSALQLRIRCASSRNARPQPSCLLLQQEG